MCERDLKMLSLQRIFQHFHFKAHFGKTCSHKNGLSSIRWRKISTLQRIKIILSWPSYFKT